MGADVMPVFAAHVSGGAVSGNSDSAEDVMGDSVTGVKRVPWVAFEFLFYCVTVRLRNISWLTYVIRSAVVSFFSGTVIPFKILPFGMDRWMNYQPFGSMGGAFVSWYVGSADAVEVIAAPLFWNVVIWIAAVVWFRKSRERMVSFGG